MIHVNLYAEMYVGAESNLNKINALYNDNKEIDLLKLASSTINLLKFTRFGVAMDFDYFGVKISRYRYMRTLDIQELFESTLIYQSITGLYETRIDLGQL